MDLSTSLTNSPFSSKLNQSSTSLNTANPSALQINKPLHQQIQKAKKKNPVNAISFEDESMICRRRVQNENTSCSTSLTTPTTQLDHRLRARLDSYSKNLNKADDSLAPTAQPHTTYNDVQIENEIDKLKLENQVLLSTKNTTNQKENNQKLLTSNNHNDLIIRTSMSATDHFDQKLNKIENYSQIIEDATAKMHSYITDMNIVYANDDELTKLDHETQPNSDSKQVDRSEMSVYDMDTKAKQESTNEERKSSMNSSSQSSIAVDTDTDNSANSSTYMNNRVEILNKKEKSEDSYLDVVINKDNLKQEIK